MHRSRWGGKHWMASVAAGCVVVAILVIGFGAALLNASRGRGERCSPHAAGGPAAGDVVTFTVTITETDASDTSLGDGVCYADLGPGSSGCTLRAALEEANKSAAPKVVVEFGAAAPGKISLAGPLRIERPLALLGPESGAVVIDGGGATPRLLEIELPAVAATEPVRISNMTFAHGYTPGSGGAITIDNFGAAVDIVFDRVVFRRKRGLRARRRDFEHRAGRARRRFALRRERGDRQRRRGRESRGLAHGRALHLYEQ